MKLKERDAGIAQRQENARWVLPSTDERLTLVTCWPPASNTYRLIVVAVPVQK
jgi:sortase A